MTDGLVQDERNLLGERRDAPHGSAPRYGQGQDHTLPQRVPGRSLIMQTTSKVAETQS